MAKFDYMEFGYSAGSCDQIVFHAKKYSREDAVKIFNEEYAYKGLKCKPEDIKDGYVKHFIRPNQFMSGDFDGPCYGFVDKPGKGSFPVLVITLAELEVA